MSLLIKFACVLLCLTKGHNGIPVYARGKWICLRCGDTWYTKDKDWEKGIKDWEKKL